MEVISTPCTGVCRLDPAIGDTCVGCGRSAAEIAAWRTLTEAQRRTIMARLAERRRATAPDARESQA
jgi:uncharacterized protein